MKTIERRVAAETLDHLAPDDPQAVRSRRDLVRVHRAMGTRTLVSRAWQSLMSPGRALKPLNVLEIGAGDGTLLLGVARSLAPRWPSVQLTLLDRQRIVSASTLAGYAELGWQARVLQADVVDWAFEHDGRGAGGGPPPRWDLICATLFLHHFEGRQLDGLLGAVATRTERFFACEPRRGWAALLGSHLVGALGANAVTREDAVLSVHAGFRAKELSARWPPDARDWRLRETPAGLFSHCFSAWRVGADT